MYLTLVLRKGGIHIWIYLFKFSLVQLVPCMSAGVGLSVHLTRVGFTQVSGSALSNEIFHDQV